MSHVAQFETEPGKPLITDLNAVKLAAKNLGLDVREDNKYRWYGHHVGDYPLPPGWTKHDMGKNAVLVLSPSEEKCKELGINKNTVYELGIVPDKNNEGCYVPMYDFFAKGQGLDKLIGSPVFDPKNRGICKQVAPTFVQHYRMCCDALTAKEQGDEIEFEEQKDGSWVSHTYPNEERLRAKL